MNIFFLFFFTILSAQNPIKCNISDDIHELYQLSILNPPDTDTFIISPSGFFQINYDSTGIDAPPSTDENLNQIPDYVEEVALAADYSRLVLVDFMGFIPVPEEGENPYPIYIENRSSGNYGVNTNSGWVEIDNDYSSGFYTYGLQAMKVTVAHEYFHAIQRKYRDLAIENRYFYEFSSTWIEDVIFPEGNDYLFWLDGPDRVWTNPGIAFSDTDGYSAALYGHYINSIIEGQENAIQSNLIREIWEKIGNTNLSFSSSINSILDNYNSSFIESWTDFIARNHFNSRNPEFYYHNDLDNIDPITIAPEDPIINYRTISMDLFPIKASLVSFVTYYDGVVSIDHNSDIMLGKIVIRAENIENDQIVDPMEIMNIPIFKDVDKMTFIYGSESNENIEIDLLLSRKPYPPAVFSGYPENGRNLLNWTKSISPLEIFNYFIYRNGEILDSIVDTIYFDTAIEPETDYIYQITAINENGESDFSNQLYITSWPNQEEINKNQIISIYPNPIRLDQKNNIYLILDSENEFLSPKLFLYDSRGRRISSSNKMLITKGRQRLNISDIIYNDFNSTGWYLLLLEYQNLNYEKIPLIIIK